MELQSQFQPIVLIASTPPVREFDLHVEVILLKSLKKATVMGQVREGEVMEGDSFFDGRYWRVFDRNG